MNIIMARKLFITDVCIKNNFAEAAIAKYSSNYFKENGWITKYFTDDWDKNLENYDIILVWSIQEINEYRHFKKDCLCKLINLQNQYNYRILDYIEDIQHTNNFYNITHEFYKRYFDCNSKNYIVGRYRNALSKNFPKCNIYTIPYSIENTMIPEFNQTPINELLLTGCINDKNYPLRHKIFTLRDTYPIYVLNHPGYRQLRHNYICKLYFGKINEYIASVSTCASSNFNYIVAKYFEIPASGALLFAYVDPVIEDLTKYGFKDMVNMVTFNNDNLTKKIEYILDPNNSDEINKIRLNGYNLILEKHTHNTRFNIEFDKFINELLEQK
jgi:hypothetical protein